MADFDIDSGFPLSDNSDVFGGSETVSSGGSVRPRSTAAPSLHPAGSMSARAPTEARRTAKPTATEGSIELRRVERDAACCLGAAPNTPVPATLVSIAGETR